MNHEESLINAFVRSEKRTRFLEFLEVRNADPSSSRSCTTSLISTVVEDTEFAIEEWLRGEQVDAKVTLHSEGIGFSCDYDFTQGVKYLVMAQRRGGVWTAFACGGTRPFPSAASDVDEIRNALRSRAPGTVQGEVFFDEFPDERVGGSVPIVGAEVTLRAVDRRLSVTTDAKGAFRLTRVPPGNYELIVNMPSNATPVPSQRVLVGANACIRRYFFSDPR
jgi:carboxypeptidase family protein